MLLSEFLNVPTEDLPMFDADIPHDTKCVIDPTKLILTAPADFDIISASNRLYDFFNTLITMYREHNLTGISTILDGVHEINDTFLGESATNIRAQGKGPDLNALKNYIDNINQMVRLINNPKRPVINAQALSVIFYLTTPNFGKDGFSDLLTNILYKDFSEYTHRVLDHYGRNANFVETTAEGAMQHQYWNTDTHMWENYVGATVIEGYPVVFVPREAIAKEYTYTAYKFIMAIPVVAEQDRHIPRINQKEAYQLIRHDNPGLSVKELAQQLINDHPDDIVQYLNRLL